MTDAASFRRRRKSQDNDQISARYRNSRRFTDSAVGFAGRLGRIGARRRPSSWRFWLLRSSPLRRRFRYWPRRGAACALDDACPLAAAASAPRPPAPAGRSAAPGAVAASIGSGLSAGVGLGVSRKRGGDGRGRARAEHGAIPAGDRTDEHRHRIELRPLVGKHRAGRLAGRRGDHRAAPPRPPPTRTASCSPPPSSSSAAIAAALRCRQTLARASGGPAPADARAIERP